MKKLLIVSAIAFTSFSLFAQQTTPAPEITKKNSWLKLGMVAGVPVGNLSDVSSFTLGLDVKGQLMQTNHVGVGLVTGYNHFFPKDNFKGFGTIPIGAFIRVYPQYKGFFAGLDGGYTFVTGIENAKGGAYLRPQLGYHNYDWNIFGFFNNVFRSDVNGGSLQNIGIGATYNLRFN